MSFETKTIDELHELILAHLRGRIPDANLAKGSDYWLRSRAIAAGTYAIQQQNLDTVRNILPSTADPAFLPEHARVRLGDANARLPAAKARGKIQVTGSVALTAIAAGLTLSHSSGAKYSISSGGVLLAHSVAGGTFVATGSTVDRVIVEPDATSILADHLIQIASPDVVRAVKDLLPEIGTQYAIEFYQALLARPIAGDAITGKIGCVLAVDAVVAGAAGNLLPGDTLTFDSAPANVDATVVVLEMTGGGDIETTEQTRARILAFMQERPGAGNRSDWREWTRSTPNVRLDDAAVYVGYRGIGTIDIVPIGVSGARQTGTSTNAAIRDYLGTVASSLDDFLVRQLIDGTTAAVTVELTVGRDFVPDWLSVNAFTVAGGSTTTVIQVTGLATLLKLGQRVLIYVASGVRPGLYQRVVTGVTTSSFTVDEALPAAPSAGSHVDPGGPICDAAIAAIVDVFDRLGPGDPAGAQRFPEPDSGWEWVLRPEMISTALMSIRGVEGAKVTAPSSTTTPAQFARVRPGAIRITFDADSQPLS